MLFPRVYKISVCTCVHNLRYVQGDKKRDEPTDFFFLFSLHIDSYSSLYYTIFLILLNKAFHLFFLRIFFFLVSPSDRTTHFAKIFAPLFFFAHIVQFIHTHANYFPRYLWSYTYNDILDPYYCIMLAVSPEGVQIMVVAPL